MRTGPGLLSAAGCGEIRRAGPAPPGTHKKMRILFALLTLLSGCHLAAPMLRTEGAIRCYALEVREWSREWPAAWGPPAIIRLDTAVARSFGPAPRWFVLQPDARLPNSRGGGGSAWQTIAGDSILLLWAGDYARIEMHLATDGPDLTGWVRGTTDVVERDDLLPRASVRARRMECPDSLAPVA